MFKSRYFGVKKVEYDGIVFDSKPERDCYRILREAERRGLISGLKLKEVFTLIPRQTEHVVKHLKTKDKIVEEFREHPLTYESDFTYMQDGRRVILDIKGGWTTEDYRIKRKVARWVGYPITECRDPYELFPDIAIRLGILPRSSAKKRKPSKKKGGGLFD